VTFIDYVVIFINKTLTLVMTNKLSS